MNTEATRVTIVFIKFRFSIKRPEKTNVALSQDKYLLPKQDLNQDETKVFFKATFIFRLIQFVGISKIVNAQGPHIAPVSNCIVCDPETVFCALRKILIFTGTPGVTATG